MSHTTVGSLLAAFLMCLSLPTWAIDSVFFGGNIASINLQPKSLSSIEKKKALSTRACNLSIPLPGNIAAASASPRDFQKAIENFREAEPEYLIFEKDLLTLEKQFGLGQEKAFDFLVIKYNLIERGLYQYFYRRSEGISHDDMVRFAETFRILSLYKEGNFDSAINGINSIKRNRGVELNYRRLDEAETHTYFTKQSLDNILGFIEYTIKYSHTIDTTEEFQLAVKYLNDRSALLPIMELFGQTSLDTNMLMAINEYGKLVLSGNVKDNKDSLLKAVWNEDNGTYVTVEFNNKAHTVFSKDTGTTAGSAGAPPPPPPVERASIGPDPFEPGGPYSNFSGSSAKIGGPSGPRGWSRNKYMFVLGGDLARDSYLRHIRKQLKKHSTDEMELFHVYWTGEHYEIELKDMQISLSQSDLRKLENGEKLPTDHPITKHLLKDTETASVLWTSPLMITKSLRKSSDELIYNLQSSYPHQRFYRDEFSNRTPALTINLNNKKVSSHEDYIALVSDKSFDIKDYNVISNIKNYLYDSGINIIEYNRKPIPFESKSSQSVIVITGDSDENLFRFVEHAGESGIFRNNLVIFNSCGTEITEEIAEKINSHYGAKGILVYQGIIDVSLVEDMLVEFLEKLKSSSGHLLTEYIQTLLKKNNLKAIWYISLIDFVDATGHRNYA